MLIQSAEHRLIIKKLKFPLFFFISRAARKQVPEEFEKPFEAQTSLFPGFDKFASGDGNSDFGTKDSVFNMFGERGKSPPGFKDGNFNFNNPDFLRPDKYDSKEGTDKGKSGGENGRAQTPSQASGNRYDPRGDYGNVGNNNAAYGGPYSKDRDGAQRGGPLKNRLGGTPSSQPIFQAADRVLGKGDNDNNINNNIPDRGNPSYPTYGPPGSNNPYRGQRQAQGPPSLGNIPSSGYAPGQPQPYGNPSQGYYGSAPANSNPSNPNISPYPGRGYAQPAVDRFGRGVGETPYGSDSQQSTPQRGIPSPAQQQPGRYPPYGIPARTGSAPNPYLGGQQQSPSPTRQGDASRYALPPASQLYFGNNSPQGTNPYTVQSPTTPGGAASSRNIPASYSFYPGQNTPGQASAPYSPTGQAAPGATNQLYRGQGSGFSPSTGFANPSYQTPNQTWGKQQRVWCEQPIKLTAIQHCSKLPTSRTSADVSSQIYRPSSSV